jgi:hypothetical protein
MSFLPPPGCDMAPTYIRLRSRFLSPAAPFSSEQYSLPSMTCRTISFVIWSFHSLISGMLMSSMNSTSWPPPLGP